MKRLVYFVLVAVSATWAACGGDGPPPGPEPGLEPAYTGNTTHISKFQISDGETSILQRHKACSDRALPTCTRTGGFCVDERTDCYYGYDANSTDYGVVDRKGCKGRSCMCCMPCILPDCKPTLSCSSGGGHCIKKGGYCHGPTVEEGCRGPGCTCCLPTSRCHDWVRLEEDTFMIIYNTTNWFEAQCTCLKLGLNLYQPYNPIAVSNYLENSTPGEYYWIGSKGNGKHQMYLGFPGIDRINYDSTPLPPWVPFTYYVATTDCAAIFATPDVFVMESGSCYTSGLNALCG